MSPIAELNFILRGGPARSDSASKIGPATIAQKRNKNQVKPCQQPKRERGISPSGSGGADPKSDCGGESVQYRCDGGSDKRSRDDRSPMDIRQWAARRR